MKGSAFLCLGVIETGTSAVIKRIGAKVGAKDGGEFALIAVADLGGDVGDGTVACDEQLGCRFDTLLPQVAGNILPVDTAKVVLEARFTDAEAGGHFVNWQMAAQISGEQSGCAFGKGDLGFRVKTAGHRQPLYIS